MKRIKWLIARWAKSFDELYENMSANTFGPANNFGFKISKFRENLITGEYIEKREYDEIIEDPFGKKVEINRFSYDITSFTFSKDLLSIELINPARRLSAFISALSMANDNELVIDNVSIDVFNWLNTLEYHIDGLAVTCIECAGLNIAENVVAKFMINGPRDVRSYLNKLTRGKAVSLERARFTFQKPMGKSSFAEISKFGGAKINNEDQDLLLPILKQTLTKNISDLERPNPTVKSTL